jgi:hypothetical protein
MHISRLRNRCRATPPPKICAQVFYPHNEKTKVVGQSFGNHGGDWEHITVRSTQEGEMLSIYFAAHGSDEGVWVAASNVHFDARGKSNRPVIFVAKAGHGSYPKQGSWSRKEGPERTFNADDDADSQMRKAGCQPSASSSHCNLATHPLARQCLSSTSFGRNSVPSFSRICPNFPRALASATRTFTSRRRQ